MDYLENNNFYHAIDGKKQTFFKWFWLVIMLVIVVIAIYLLYGKGFSNQNYKIINNLPSQVGNFTLENVTDITSQYKEVLSSQNMNPDQLIAGFRAHYVNDNLMISTVDMERFLFNNASDTESQLHYSAIAASRIASLFNTKITQINFSDNITEIYLISNFGTYANISTNGQFSQVFFQNGNQSITPSTPLYFLIIEQANGNYLSQVNYIAIGNNFNITSLSSVSQQFLRIDVNNITISTNST